GPRRAGGGRVPGPPGPRPRQEVADPAGHRGLAQRLDRARQPGVALGLRARGAGVAGSGELPGRQPVEVVRDAGQRTLRRRHPSRSPAAAAGPTTRRPRRYGSQAFELLMSPSSARSSTTLRTRNALTTSAMPNTSAVTPTSQMRVAAP